MNSERPSRRPVKAPFDVRWREFRIQLLPLVAFALVLGVAGVLWQRAVVPVSVRPAARPVIIVETAAEPDAPLVNAALEQASHGITNEIVRVPEGSQ